MQIDINPSLAEIIGILLGDGNIYKNDEKWQYQIDISLNQIDEPNYVLHVKELMEDVFQKPIKTVNQHGKAISLRYYNKELTLHLIELGLKAGRKTINQIKVPDLVFNDHELIKFCLKGLFDTDGSIAIDSPKDLRLSFSNCSKPLVKDFFNMCLKLGITPSPRLKFSIKKNSWRVVIAKKEEIEKFIKIVQPEKLKEPYRRKWIALRLIHLNSPSPLKFEIKRKIEEYLKSSNQTQFRFSKDNTFFLKKLCEELLKIRIDSDKVNRMITKVLTLEKFMYNHQKAEELKSLYENLRSAKRIVEFLIDHGEMVIPYRQTISKHIHRYFIETKQDYNNWIRHYPKFRIGKIKNGEIRVFPRELRNQITYNIVKILSSHQNKISNFEVYQKLKISFQKDNLLIIT
ncbi:MAG: hypothetical protein EAX89_11870, partial [Candidatus Lokiarchaeota archaeon]|nr:hypothetical protein [Candidatus Lokiarchaeota archaeon]